MMSIKIAAVCDNELSGKMLKECGEKMNFVVNYEVQNGSAIINKLSDNIIKTSNIVLFVTEKEIEQIEEIERFITTICNRKSCKCTFRNYNGFKLEKREIINYI